MPSDLVVKSGLNIRSASCELIPVPVSATDTITRSPSYASDLMLRILGSSLRRHRVDGVHDQVQEHLLQLDPISSYLRQLPVRLGLDEYPVLLQIATSQGERFLDELIEVE